MIQKFKKLFWTEETVFRVSPEDIDSFFKSISKELSFINMVGLNEETYVVFNSNSKLVVLELGTATRVYDSFREENFLELTQGEYDSWVEEVREFLDFQKSEKQLYLIVYGEGQSETDVFIEEYSQSEITNRLSDRRIALILMKLT